MQKIKQAMQKGCVWLERKNKTGSFVQRLRRAKKFLGIGDVVHIYYDEKVLAMKPAPAELIHDAGDYSVWNKPCGMLSQGSKWGDHCTIYRWAESHLKPQRQAFLVHRLDRAANGLMILAHKKSVAAEFSQMFRKHELEKNYQAIVSGDFSTKINNTEALVMESDIDGKKAKSIAQFISYDADQNTSIVNMTIETGRKHQIRKHLSGLGFPIVGDRLYGGDDSKDLQLTSKKLSFSCPITAEIKHFKLGS